MSEFSPCFEEILEISTINGSHVPHGRWQPESFYLAKPSCFIFSKFTCTYWQSCNPVLITVFLLAQLTYVLPLQQYKENKKQTNMLQDTCAHKHTRQPTHTAHYTEAYLITILLIVQPVGVAREGGVREIKREKEREAGKEPEAA